jgi:glutamine amidotransferase/cyclase
MQRTATQQALSSQDGTMRPRVGSRRSAVRVQAGGEVTLLDYGAGNVRSVRNAIKKLGYTIKDVSIVTCPHGVELRAVRGYHHL